ncbi:MAG TPA: barstar family protein [Planosporangium sp.]|jgi:hypothetical protein|nr:barstar family protein [Planosporangium sp.]
MPESSRRWLRVVTGEPPAPATHVAGGACRTRAGLFTEWAARLRFPEYFGHNWDALADCLKDLAGPKDPAAEQPLTLVVDDAPQLLADEPPAQLRTLLTILYDVAGTYPGTLEVVFACEPGDEQALRQRITAAAA